MHLNDWVIIELGAPTTSYQTLTMSRYAQIWRITGETDETVYVTCNDETYEFKKIYILKRF